MQRVLSPNLCFLLIMMCFGPALKLSADQSTKSNNSASSDYSSEAYVVEQSAEKWTFENDGTGTRERIRRIRIQSDAAVQDWGVLTFPYQKAVEILEIDYVRVHKPDGTIVTTPLDDLQDMPTEVTREAPFYSDLREKQLAVKALSRGDVLEFQCHWKINNPLIPGQFWISVTLPAEEVVLERTVEVRVPRDRAIKVKSITGTPVISEDGAYRSYRWYWANMEPPERKLSELAMLGIHGTYPAPDIQLSSFQSWEELGHWYEALQRSRVEPSPEIRAKAAELTRNMADDTAKILAIYKYVSTEFRYIGVGFGIGRYQPHFASEVLSNQYGDCKDKHTLLASLLTAAGITAYPALINSARVIDLDVPSPAQFNHVITVVPRGKEVIWLDATGEVAPAGNLKTPLRDKPALVLSSDKVAFQTTPQKPPSPSSWTFKINAMINETGTLEGKVEQVVYGDLAIIWRGQLRRLSRAQWKDFVQGVSYWLGFAGEVSDVTVAALENIESPLQLSYTYKRKEYPDWANRRVSPPAPIVLRPPLEEDGKLQSRYYLGPPGELNFESRIQLPKGFTWILPEARHLQRDFAEYHITYGQVENTLITNERIVTKMIEVSGSAVNEFKTFAEQLQENQNRFVPVFASQMNGSQQAAFRFHVKARDLPDSKDPTALEFENKAKAALDRNSTLDAIDSLRQAVAQDPKFTRAWIFLADIYMASNQQDQAIEAVRKGVGSDPKQVICYKILASMLLASQRRTEAIEAWQNLRKVAPEDPDIPVNLGSLFVAERRYSDAVPYLEAAMKLSPDTNSIIFALADAYLNKGDEEKALGLFDKLLQLVPGQNTKNSIAYELAVANKRLDQAFRYAQEAVGEEEESSRKVDLEKLVTEDLRHTPNLGAYWDTLGWVQYRMDNLKQAEEYLYAAWLLQQDAVTGYHLAQVYEKESRPQDAAHIYWLVADQHPRSDEARDAVAEAKKRLEALPPPSQRNRFDLNSGQELSDDRTTKLPKLVKGKASAEFFLLFAPGVKVAATKFVSGSPELQSAGNVLTQARFKVAFPEASSGRLLRRGILACYPLTGCTFVLLPTDSVTKVY